MDNCNEIFLEDLIECDVEETDGSSHAVWTEQALDLFISQLKNANKLTFPTERDMLQVVRNKMSHRNFSFTIDQIENKYNSLRKMYNDKREKNQAVEPELVKLFGEIKPSSSKRQNSLELKQSPKKYRIDLTEEDDDSSSPKINKSDEEITFDENGKIKMIWSTQSNKFFLDLLEEHRPLLGSKFRTKKQMWEEISRRLKTRGFHLTWSQVENKWKYLVRHYRSRLEMMRSQPKTKVLSKSAFPELFESPPKSSPSAQPKRVKKDDVKISFANDQKLPFDDDDEDDDDNEDYNENPFQFEEACPLPEVDNVSTENFDPVYIEDDVKPKGIELNALETSAKLDQISRELANFRKDSRKHQAQALAIKKQEMEAYKERTEQFTKISDTLTELLGYMKSRDGHF